MARPQGSVSKNKQFLLHRLQDMYGEDFHPIMKLAEIAADKENDIRLRFDAWKEIAKYTEPQLKAVDHKIEGDVGLIIEVVNFEDTTT
jgi:hypothetical protein